MSRVRTSLAAPNKVGGDSHPRYPLQIYMIQIHYALQTHDLSSLQGHPRFASESKSEIVEKCVTSFLTSVEVAAKLQPDSNHTIAIFDDRSTEKTVSFLKHATNHFTGGNLSVQFIPLEESGIMNSIKTCYKWMQDNGQDLVYQIQDDFLYEPLAIYEMVSLFFQLHGSLQTHSIITPVNDPKLWTQHYLYKSTPRMIVPSISRYWMQCYNIPVSFLTSKEQFGKHWDLYNKFLSMDPNSGEIEAVTLNLILQRRNVLGMAPFESIAMHMAYEGDKEPYIDWRARWDAVPKL